MQLFKNDELIAEYENEKFFSIGEYIWIGTDSHERSSPDTAILIATIHRDSPEADADLSLDMFKVVEDKMMPFKDHAAIIRSVPEVMRP